MADLNRPIDRGSPHDGGPLPPTSRVDDPIDVESTTLLSILLRHRRVVVLSLVLFGVIGLVVSQLIATSFVGVAQVIVQDPRAASQFDVTDVRPSTQDSERYLADQVKVFESGIVASHVADDLGVDVNRVSDSIEVTGDLTSNLIEIRYSADTAEEAMTGANGVVSAYVRVVSAQVRENASVALQKIDALQQSLDDKIDALSVQINELLTNSTRSEVEDQIDATIDELTRLRDERDALAVGTAARDALAVQITELTADLDALRLSLDLEAADPELDALISEQNQALALRSDLDTRRNTIEVDLELASANLALVSPAQLPQEPSGIPPFVTIVGFLALGALVGLAGGHALDLRQVMRARGDATTLRVIGESVAPDVGGRQVEAERIEGAGRTMTVASEAEVWTVADGHPDAEPPQVDAGPPVDESVRDEDDWAPGPASDPTVEPVAAAVDHDTLLASAEEQEQPGMAQADVAVFRDAEYPVATTDDEQHDEQHDEQDLEQDSEEDHPEIDRPDVDFGALGGSAETSPADDPDFESVAVRDDFTLLDGIGPKVQGLLYDHGIRRFGELADQTPEGIQDILDEAGSAFQLCDPRSWPLQAKLAQSGRWTALKAYKASIRAGAKR